MNRIKKIHWGDLTESQKEYFGCGIGKTMFLIPQFIFKASCQQHDFYYRRGGGIVDKLKADLYFYSFMLQDICDYQGNILKLLFYFFMATLYFGAVSLFGCFFFSWGKYKTKKELFCP